MDFAIPDLTGVGHADPALLRSRGADPLVEIPTAHFFRAVSGIPLQPIPGALSPVSNAIPYSVIESVLGAIIAVDKTAAAGAHDCPLLSTLIAPAKFEAALAQAFLEPPNVKLDPNARYTSLSAAAAAIREFTCRLDPAALHPAYVLTLADVFSTEPVASTLPAPYRSLYAPNSAITFGSIADDDDNFLVHLSFLGFVMYGRALSSSRDTPNSPTRAALAQIESFSAGANLLRTGANISAAALKHWLDLTTLPGGLAYLTEVGVGIDRREQCLRDRHLLVYGDTGQKESILANLALRDPLRSRLPNIGRVLGAKCSAVDARISILRMVRGVLGSATADMASIAMLENLEPALRNLVLTLTMPALVGASLSQRVDAVVRAANDNQITTSAISAGSSATDTTPGAHSSDKATAGVFADELAYAMGQSDWRLVEAQLTAELQSPVPSALRLHDLIINSPVLGARRLALGVKDSTLTAVSALSKPLALALHELQDFNLVASMMLVCDLATMSTLEPNLISFRLAEKTATALKRGAFDEIDWVKDILIAAIRAENPNMPTDQFAMGLYDPSVVPQLEPLMQRISRLLGLPLQPPPTPAPAALALPPLTVPPPPPLLFSSLSQIVTTINLENLDIRGRPTPFDSDYLAQLKLFETTAWREAAAEFKHRVAAAKNPAGPLLYSILPQNSAARGTLAMMRTTKRQNRTDATTRPKAYAMLVEFQARQDAASQGPALAASHQSPTRPRSRSHSPDQAQPPRFLLKGPTTGRPSALVSPGSRVETTLAFAADGSAFWYTQPETRARVSAVYDYATLERIAGKTRHQLDFPVLLSTMPPNKRMTLCAFSHLPHHKTGGAAHLPPFADFLDQVKQHFREPAAQWAPAVGNEEGTQDHGHAPNRGTLALWEPSRGKSPTPNDARRSHRARPPAGQPQRRRGDERSPRHDRSRSISPADRGRSASSSPNRAAQQRAPASGAAPSDSRDASVASDATRVAAAPDVTIKTDAAASSSEAPPGAGRPRSPRSPKGRLSPSSAQKARWLGSLIVPGRTNGSPTATTPFHGGERRDRLPMLSLVDPSCAVVRTILLVVALAGDSPMRLLVPPDPTDVIGIASPRAEPRGAAVSAARLLAAALQLPGLQQAHHCIPIAERIPTLGDISQSVDRLVALPLGPALAALATRSTTSQMEGWNWLTLGALSGLAVYALAALAFARLRSYYPSASVTSARRLLELNSQWRSGARQHRSMSLLASRRRPALGKRAQPGHDAASGSQWMHARASMAAADAVLQNMLLAIPAMDPDAEGLHAFADLLKPLNDEEVPPSFKLDGGLPSFDRPDLYSQPFSVRVAAPRTSWLPRRPPQPTPPASFAPNSIEDLLEPRWFAELQSWYTRLGAWLLDLSDAVQLSPDDDNALQAVLSARPKALVVMPASGFVPAARGIIWDLRRGVPVPVDFARPIDTHLNLTLVRSWMRRFPDFPDRELFSHLLEGVRFKTPLATQIVLQPHLSSLAQGFMSVHRELLRLTEKGFFEAFTHPPYAPWVTLPMGVAFRKLEPDRPRRTTDGGAPRKGVGSSQFLVDADGVRVLPLNLLARHPSDDIQRGTASVFHDAWASKLDCARSAPPPAHGPMRATSPRPPPRVLLLFSGPCDLPSALAHQLAGRGLEALPVDRVLHDDADLSRESVVSHHALEISRGAYAFVFISTPCKSYSVAVDDSRPQLRSRVHPRGLASCPPEWRAYVDRHNTLADASLACILAAESSGTAWALENPAPRWDVDSPAYWQRFRDWGTLWDILAKAGIAPLRFLPAGTPARARDVSDATFAACAFGADYQKYTTVWASRGASSLTARLRGHPCPHPVERHAVVLQGRRPDGDGVAAVAAAYTPLLAAALAEGIESAVHAAAIAASLPLAMPPSSPARPTVGPRPAAPALRNGCLVDIDITRSGHTPLLSNPFKLGPTGKDECLRQLAVATYVDWLDMRTVAAARMISELPVAASLQHATGDHVLSEVHRIVHRYGRDSAFNLVCGARCQGKLCHGTALALLFEQVTNSTSAPPFPKELKPTIPEIMTDLAVLLHLSHLTGIPVYQVVSDVKDFFNQHHVAPEDRHKVGLVTLDPRAIVAHAAHLRQSQPDLANIAENVLGYGLACASNICQRTAHLLVFVWLVEMQLAAAPVVHALRRRYPAIRAWLDNRASRHDPAAAAGKYSAARYAQARLWAVSMYTDDGHQAMLGPELTIIGLRTWRKIMQDLRLTMAIVQKHGLGQQVTVQGCRFNTGLGVVFVPEDKLRRAIRELDEALAGRACLREYHSLVSFLQSLTFVVGMSRSAAYGLYAPLANQSGDPDSLVCVSAHVAQQLRAWRSRLLACAGAPLYAAMDHAPGARPPPLPLSAPAVFFLRSDASKEGASLPGLGGALGALLWRYPHNASLSDDELLLPIAVLEFAAYYGTVEVFDDLISLDAMVISEVDALASADAITTEAARSPLMQHVHTRLLQLPAFQSLEGRHGVGHIYGDANVMADAASRGNFAVAREVASQLGMTLQWRRHGPLLRSLMRELVALHAAESASLPDHPSLAGTTRGVHNINMTGSPIAHSVAVSGAAAHITASRPNHTSSLAGTTRGVHNLNMTGSPIAHSDDVLDTSVLEHWLMSGSATRAMHASLQAAGAASSLPWELPPSPAPAALPSGHILAPPPPSIFAPVPHVSLMAPRPSADQSAASSIAAMLVADASSLALRPTSFDIRTLCAELYDPSTAQPVRTSQGQNSAWKHWEAWCVVNNTAPWRLTRHATDTDFHREAVLQAGFVRFCHVRQSACPRGGRQAALVSSALKTLLCHVRKMHRDRNFPMCPSPLVTAQVRRLLFEYKSTHGVHDMIPKRKEPFTRAILVDIILATPEGFATNLGNHSWLTRAGRSLRGLVATLAQAGFRKGEVSVTRAGAACDANCLSRSALSWLLGGRAYAAGEAPAALLARPQLGDFAVLTPCPSKSDPFDVVWGGDPIWLPFQHGEPLCAFLALADIETHDALPAGANPCACALFTTNAALPFSDAQLDRLLHCLLSRVLPPASVKLYSWHSARIFLATTLLESGASHPEIQALCRWQTTDSIKIYARLNSASYARLINGAMAARVSTARAQNLALAVPFIDVQDVRRAAAAAPPPLLRPDNMDLNVHPDDDADDDDLDDCRDSPAAAHTAPAASPGDSPAPPPLPRRVQPPATPRTQVSRRSLIRRVPAPSPAPAFGHRSARARASFCRPDPPAPKRARHHSALAVENPNAPPPSSVSHLAFRFPATLDGYLTFARRPSLRRPPTARRVAPSSAVRSTRCS